MIVSRRKLLSATAAGVGIATLGTTTAVPAHAATTTSLDDWLQPGDLSMSIEVQANATLYFPTDIRSLSALPVIVWGNGTGGIPYVYRELFRHWVSRGVIVVAANTPNSGLAILMRLALTKLILDNANPRSRFFERVDTAAISTSGHSQGGASAISAGSDSRISSVIPVQPGPLADVRGLHSPLLLLTGDEDAIVYPPLYVEGWIRDRAEVPMVYGSLRGADHFDAVLTAEGGGFRAVTAAWIAALFQGDSAAAGIFFGPAYTLVTDPRWRDVQRNSAGAAFTP